MEEYDDENYNKPIIMTHESRRKSKLVFLSELAIGYILLIGVILMVRFL